MGSKRIPGGTWKLDSTELKLYALEWLRFKKRCIYFATEFLDADIYGLMKTQSLEIEVKVSKSDFRSDFSKAKHLNIKFGHTWAPNYFYFLVPLGMVEYCLDFLNKKEGASVRTWPIKIKSQELSLEKYGLMTVDPKEWSTDTPVKIVRRAKKIHDNPPPENHFRSILLRMGSELILTWNRYHDATQFRMNVTKNIKRMETLIDSEAVQKYGCIICEKEFPFEDRTFSNTCSNACEKAFDKKLRDMEIGRS